MSDYPTLAGDLTRSLELSLPPIALAFCETVPPQLRPFDGIVPAGCAFWQEAATRMFATSTADHELCSIGVHTHNLAAPSGAVLAELQHALRAMSGLDYVRTGKRPTVQESLKRLSA